MVEFRKTSTPEASSYPKKFTNIGYYMGEILEIYHFEQKITTMCIDKWLNYDYNVTVIKERVIK